MKKSKQMSETFLLGILLAIVGGFLDAYTYITRDHVFANAQTGNMVLLGLNLAEKNFRNALYYMVPIAAFVAGIVISEWIKNQYKDNTRIHWRQIIILIETLIVTVIAFVPEGKLNVIVNIAISFVCSMQVQSFRKLNGNAYATTMCTGNLRSATEQMVLYSKTKNKSTLSNSLQYYGIIAFFILGAVIGAGLTSRFEVQSVLFCSFILSIVCIIMFKKSNI